MLQKKNIVVFDFDGTLSASDSNYEFFKYCVTHSLRPMLFLPHMIVGGIGSLLNRKGIWWRETVRSFMTPKMVRDFSNDFIALHKQRRFKWVKKKIAEEKKSGNMVILISAGPDYLIPELVADIDFDAIICSKMKQDKPHKYNFLCWNKNKVIALDKWAVKHKIIPNIVRSYSDSPRSDMPIMEIAREQVWINPKTGKVK